MKTSGTILIDHKEIDILKKAALEIENVMWKDIYQKYQYIFDKCPPLIYIFKEAIKNKHNIQPGFIVETVLAASLAFENNMKNFEYFENSKDRFKYFNNNDVIIQKGGCTDTDLYFNNIPIEIKDLKSVAGEIDLFCNDDGTISTTKYSSNTKDRFVKMLPFIKEFNNNHTIWEMEGHNYSLPITQNNARNILYNYFANNKVEYLLTYNKQNYFFLIDVKTAADNIDFSGSEIRTCGKNHVKLYSKEHFITRLKEIGGVYDESSKIVAIRKDKATIRGSRGGNSITGYKIGALFFMPIKYVKEYKGMYYTYIDKIQQQKQSISLHISLKEAA